MVASPALPRLLMVVALSGGSRLGWVKASWCKGLCDTLQLRSFLQPQS